MSHIKSSSEFIPQLLKWYHFFKKPSMPNKNSIYWGLGIIRGSKRVQIFLAMFFHFPEKMEKKITKNICHPFNKNQKTTKTPIPPSSKLRKIRPPGDAGAVARDLVFFTESKGARQIPRLALRKKFRGCRFFVARKIHQILVNHQYLDPAWYHLWQCRGQICNLEFANAFPRKEKEEFHSHITKFTP